MMTQTQKKSKLLDGFHADVLSRLAPMKQPDGFHERWRQLYTIGTKFTIIPDKEL
ncbi:MAG: hypothetical protein NVSMB27_43660 [Ktedonobacteraceae bacterium]